jgi:hypothetical protein
LDPLPLLELSDDVLLLVMQCCVAIDPFSIFSVSRAHSRLHKAAKAAMRSIKAVLSSQQQVDGVMRYLGEHCSHVISIELRGDEDRPWAVEIHQLPPNLRLTSLRLQGAAVQLQPWNGFQGLLGAAAQVAGLKQLRLKDCTLLDSTGNDALAAALSPLARLEHLSISDRQRSMQLPTAVFWQLQHLTYLELAYIGLYDRASASIGSLAMQALHALTRLVDLRLADVQADDGRATITASMLSVTCHLTRLMLTRCSIEPRVLDGKTLLQHLHLAHCSMPGGIFSTSTATRIAQLLSHLQPLQQLQPLQLNHMNLAWSARDADLLHPPTSDFSALTASSKLQHLDVSCCTLPAGVWQHLFPAGRQLPHLQSLDISYVKHSMYGAYAAAPEGSILVSCCPGLQSLDMRGLQYNAELLASLQELSELHTLSLTLDDHDHTAENGVQAVCQLTGLRELRMDLPCFVDVTRLLQLTQLQQLTALTCDGPWAVVGWRRKVRLVSKVGNSDDMRYFPTCLAVLRFSCS